jgi:hypothetical protein
MTDLRKAVDMVVELSGKGAALIGLRVQWIIAQAESEALQEHVAKLDRLIAELVAACKTQPSGKVRRPQVGYNFDTAVDKAVAILNRIFRGMTETQRQQALDATVDRLGAGKRIHLAA